MLAGKPVESMESFTVAPVTLDRPFFYAALRIDRLGALLRRLEVLPQQEIGVIVNLAVLAQALAIAAAVLPVGRLADYSNSGTLFAFLMVAISVMVLRRTDLRDAGLRRPIIRFAQQVLQFHHVY